MATTYTITPNPIWNSFDLSGRPAGGAALFSYRADEPTVQKPIYQDPDGATAWPNPVVFMSNGEAPQMLFFADDVPYYLELHATSDPTSDLIWSAKNFGPGIAGGGGGGGGGTTVVSPITNYITNGVFYQNIGSTTLTTASTLLAPSNHDIDQPDIRFIKDSPTAVDRIDFQLFSPIGGNQLSPDTTPEYYMQYSCTTLGSESVKSLQFPICKHVQNLSSQAVTLQFWARSISGSATLKLFWYQNFGDGGSPSPSVQVAFTNTPSVALTNTWQEFNLTETVPSVAGKALGTCGNDGFYIRFGFPTDQTTVMQFTKPEFYIGNFQPPIDFSTYDEIDAIINSSRTGDIVTSMRPMAPLGWLGMNDTTIGSSASGSDRANVDTYPLFSLIWNAMHTNPTYAPIYTNAGVTTTYGANAIADFTANKRLSLPKSLGQVFAGTGSVLAAVAYTPTFSIGLLTVASTASFGTAVPVIVLNSGGAAPTGLTAGKTYYAINLSTTTLKLASTPANALAGTFVNFTDNGTGTNTIQVKANGIGTFEGEYSHTLVNSELPAQLGAANVLMANGGGGTPVLISTADGAGYLSNVTGGNSHNNLQPTTYMNVFIKL